MVGFKKLEILALSFLALRFFKYLSLNIIYLTIVWEISFIRKVISALLRLVFWSYYLWHFLFKCFYSVWLVINFLQYCFNLEFFLKLTWLISLDKILCVIKINNYLYSFWCKVNIRKRQIERQSIQTAVLHLWVSSILNARELINL